LGFLETAFENEALRGWIAVSGIDPEERFA
jgi:hypothetical protein